MIDGVKSTGDWDSPREDDDDASWLSQVSKEDIEAEAGITAFTSDDGEWQDDVETEQHNDHVTVRDKLLAEGSPELREEYARLNPERRAGGFTPWEIEHLQEQVEKLFENKEETLGEIKEQWPEDSPIHDLPEETQIKIKAEVDYFDNEFEDEDETTVEVLAFEDEPEESIEEVEPEPELPVVPSASISERVGKRLAGPLNKTKLRSAKVFGVIATVVFLTAIPAILSGVGVGTYLLVRDDGCDNAARNIAQYTSMYREGTLYELTESHRSDMTKQYRNDRTYLAHSKCDDDRPYANEALESAGLDTIKKLD